MGVERCPFYSATASANTPGPRSLPREKFLKEALALSRRESPSGATEEAPKLLFLDGLLSCSRCCAQSNLGPV
jgi:hypothetical protein